MNRPHPPPSGAGHTVDEDNDHNSWARGEKVGMENHSSSASTSLPLRSHRGKGSHYQRTTKFETAGASYPGQEVTMQDLGADNGEDGLIF